MLLKKYLSFGVVLQGRSGESHRSDERGRRMLPVRWMLVDIRFAYVTIDGESASRGDRCRPGLITHQPLPAAGMAVPLSKTPGSSP